MGEFIIDTIATAIKLVACALGIPGNILSAIVWLRSRKNSSAINLAALAMNDLECLLISLGVYIVATYSEYELYWSFTQYLLDSTFTLEPLLILGFSVERLFAILRPFQVSFPHVNINRLLTTCALLVIRLYFLFSTMFPLFKANSKCIHDYRRSRNSSQSQ